mgnify:CR=1 FL=1
MTYTTLGGFRGVVITDVNQDRLDLAARVADVVPVNVAHEDLKAVEDRLKMKEGFDVGLEMSGAESAFNQMLSSIRHGGQIAALGIPPEPITLDINDVILKGLTVQGIYGRKIFETWYKGTMMYQTGLPLEKIITHRFHYTDFQQGFDVMRSGNSGKVVLNWEDA